MSVLNNTERRRLRPRRISRRRAGPAGIGRRSLFGGRSRDGATIVEFAIIANVMIIMVLTCIEFARMNMTRNLMQDAAYFAARHAVVPGATADEAIAEAERIMGSMLTNGYNVEVSNLDSESEEIEVTVEVDMHAVALFAPNFLPSTTISTTANMRTERYSGFYQQ